MRSLFESDASSQMPREPKHHYIPIFYLQQWAADGQLVEYCRRYEGVVARPTFPGGTGYVRGLYKLPDAQPGQEYVIETKLMSSIDDRAAKAMQRMMVDGEATGKLKEPEALGWCQFLYSLIVRNPEQMVITTTMTRSPSSFGPRRRTQQRVGVADASESLSPKKEVRSFPMAEPPVRGIQGTLAV